MPGAIWQISFFTGFGKYGLIGHINLEHPAIFLKYQSDETIVRVRPMVEKIKADTVEIVPFADQYRDAWRDINVQWLETYFYLEPEDRKNLDQPEKYILDKGGEIFIALLQGEPVGVVALKYFGQARYEISKMGVRPKAQGHGIGARLLTHAIDRYHDRKGQELFLETHSKLETAIRLYEKCGFVEAPLSEDTPYDRADYCMIYQPVIK